MASEVGRRLSRSADRPVSTLREASAASPTLGR